MSLFNTSNAARHVPRKTKASPKRKVSWKDKSKHHQHIQSHQTNQKQQIQVVQNGIRRISHVPQAPSGKNATPLDYNRTGPLAGKKKKKEMKKRKQKRRHAISIPLSMAVNNNRLGNNNKNREGSNVLSSSTREAHVKQSRMVNEGANKPDQLQDQLDSFEFDLRGTTIDSLSVKPAEFNFCSIVQDIEHSNVFKIGTPVKKGTLMGKIENYDSIRGVYVIMYDTGVWEEMTEEDIKNKLGLSFKGNVMEQAI